MFEDRCEAGHLLAAELTQYRGASSGIILALPRGGVVVAFAVHQALGLPLDVYITRKLRAPENPEFALGAVTETGYRFVNPDVQELVSDAWVKSYLERETKHQRQEIERRKQLYRNGNDLPDLRNRTVLVVDDGVATGSTFMAAVRGIQARSPARLVAATPVGSSQAIEALRREADEVVVVSVPVSFRAVGEHYIHFPQVEDSEVVTLLQLARKPNPRNPLPIPGLQATSPQTRQSPCDDSRER